MDMTSETVALLKSARPGWMKRNWGRYTKTQHSPTHATKAGMIQVVSSPAAMDNLNRVLAEIA